MGSKVFMTYKRKRLLSGSDDNHLDLHTDTHPEILVSKSSENFDEHGRPMCEHSVLNEGRDFGIHDENSLKNGGKSMVQCVNCYSQHQDRCSEEHIPKLQSLSSISKCNSSEQKTISENSDGKQTTFPQGIVAEGVSAKGKLLNDPSKLISENSNGKQIAFCPDVVMEEVSAEGKSCDDPVKTLFKKLDISDNEKFRASPSPDAVSPMESDTVLPQVPNKVSERGQKATFSGAFTSEETSTLCNDSVANWKRATSLITYQRKPKRNKNTTASDIASETPLARSLLHTLKDGKKPSEDIDNSSTSPIPALGVETAVATETEFPHHAAASHNIDCNVPLVPVFDENHPPGPSEVPPRDMQTVQARRRDKGKAVMYSSPALAATSSKTNYLQLFPENSMGDTLRLGNGREKVQVAHQACYYPPYPVPGFQLYPRETYHDFLALTPDHTQTFSSHKMMHDNYLNRARGVRVGGNFLPDNFRSSTAWSEEELDCLWIGVRRHGRGNWGAILRDRKLQISPWRTPLELAEKWREEQSRVFPITSVTQPRYLNPFMPSTLIDEAQLSLGNPHAGHNWGIPNRPQFFHPMSIPIHQPVPISGPLPAYGYYNPSGGTMSGKGHLPHWLREVAGPSMLPNSTDSSRNQCLNQPNLGPPVIVRHRGNVGRKRGKVTAPDLGKATVPDNGLATVPELAKATVPDSGLIVIPSDGSSEETISDDRNGNGRA